MGPAALFPDLWRHAGLALLLCMPFSNAAGQGAAKAAPTPAPTPRTAPATAAQPAPPASPKLTPAPPPAAAPAKEAAVQPGAAPGAPTPTPTPTPPPKRTAGQLQQDAAARQRAAAKVQAEAHGVRMQQFGPLRVDPVDAGPLGQPCDPIGETELAPLIAAAAQDNGLDPKLIRAVMEQESAMLPCAYSSKGAQGLMQLTPATADELGVKDPFDPKENVSGGARYLKQLLDKFAGDLEKTLSAYNAGPNAPAAAGGVAQNAETQAYVAAIMKKLGN
jgi:soluble lytic murein transglycosylase-like protein